MTPNKRGIGPLVGRSSRHRRSVMHVLAVILSTCITCHFFFICQNIFIRVIWSGREICPLLMYPYNCTVLFNFIHVSYNRIINLNNVCIMLMIYIPWCNK